MTPFDIGNRYSNDFLELKKSIDQNAYYKQCFRLEYIFFGHLIDDLICNNKLFKHQELIQHLVAGGVIDDCVDYLIENKIPDQSEIFESELLTKHDIGSVVDIAKANAKEKLISMIRDRKDDELLSILSNNLESLEDFVDYLVSFMHFGLTSQDIVNVCYTKIWSDGVMDFNKSMRKMLDAMNACLNKDYYMLAFTHGQPAVPMKVNRLNKVYNEKIRVALYDTVASVKSLELKFGSGAVGGQFTLLNLLEDTSNYDTACNQTIYDFFPGSHSIDFSQESFQNNNYPNIFNSLRGLLSLCTTMLDMTQDMWLYSLMGYFTKNSNINEVGSSTMPQKVNPIEFENAEGNLKLAIGLINTYLNNLNVSRLQRDLSDITMMRSVTIILLYVSKAVESLEKGFTRYSINKREVKKDLADNLQCFSEYLQLYCKINDYGEDSYKMIKSYSISTPNWNAHTLSKVCHDITGDRKLYEKLMDSID